MNSKCNMRNIFIYMILGLLFSSCGTSYYYAQMQSNDPYMEKDVKGNFVVDSDSLSLIYSFHGENAPVKVTVRNKMERPIYIDWRQSYFIFGDNDSNRISLGEYFEPWEVMEVVRKKAEQTKVLFELSNLNFDKTNEELFRNKTVTKADGKTVKLKSIDYNERNTPLYIRSSIALRVGNVQEEPLYFNQDFYISTLTKSRSVTPKKLAAYANMHGDSFYTRKEHGKGFKQFLNVTGQVLIVTGAIAVEVILSTGEGE